MNYWNNLQRYLKLDLLLWTDEKIKEYAEIFKNNQTLGLNKEINKVEKENRYET